MRKKKLNCGLCGKLFESQSIMNRHNCLKSLLKMTKEEKAAKKAQYWLLYQQKFLAARGPIAPRKPKKKPEKKIVKKAEGPGPGLFWKQTFNINFPANFEHTPSKKFDAEIPPTIVGPDH